MNDFNELIGADVAEEERARLVGVHELLVQVGPPPELSEALKNAPRPGDVRSLRRPSVARKVALLAAAIIVLGVTFSLGFATGHAPAAASKPLESVVLSGTTAAPHAQATLDVSQEVSGNWPMTLHVTGLAKVAAPEYYEVWLVRNGQPWAPCGEFVVSKPGELTLPLNSPYTLKRGDTWIVTQHTDGQNGAGRPVLRPVTA